MRSCVSSALALYEARDHADSALQVASIMLSELPPSWFVDAKFVVLVLRLTGVELRAAVDDVEHDAATSGAPPSTSTALRRLSTVIPACTSIFEQCVRGLTSGVLGADDDDGDGRPSGPIAAAWSRLPAETILHIRACLEDIVRLCCSFLSGVLHGGAALSNTLLLPSSNTFGDATATAALSEDATLAAQLLASAAVRIVGGFVAEDTESFGAEVLEVLPIVCRMRPLAISSMLTPVESTPSTAAADAVPQCLQAPLACFLPGLVLRTADETFLTPYLDCDVATGVLTWLGTSARALLWCLCELQCAAADGSSSSRSADGPAWLGPLLSLHSFALSSTVNVLTMCPLARRTALKKRVFTGGRDRYCTKGPCLTILSSCCSCCLWFACHRSVWMTNAMSCLALASKLASPHVAAMPALRRLAGEGARVAWMTVCSSLHIAKLCSNEAEFTV